MVRARDPVSGPATPLPANSTRASGTTADAMPREPGANREVEGVVDGRQGRVESVRAPATRRGARGSRPGRGRARRSGRRAGPDRVRRRRAATLRPSRVIVRPKLAMRSGSSHSRSLGPAIATDLAVSSVATSAASASGAGALSSARSHSASASDVGSSRARSASADRLSEREVLRAARRRGSVTRRRSARGRRRRPR